MSLEREHLIKEATFRQAEGLVLADPERLIHKMLAHFQVTANTFVLRAWLLLIGGVLGPSMTDVIKRHQSYKFWLAVCRQICIKAWAPSTKLCLQ